MAVRHFGVPLGEGAWGRRGLAVHFTVGREQIVEADARSHRMIVVRDGRPNVTHGCVNLAPEDAERYFATALYGDPVEVTGSPVPMGSDDGDFYDWTVPWETWRTMSALRT